MATDPDPESPVKPMSIDANQGEAWWWFNSLAVVKAGAADTNGQMTIIEVTEPAGEAAPRHVHHQEDEAFWIIEGDATFTVGDQVIEASAGHFLYGPRGIPHSYVAGSKGCRMLFILTPGGFEELVMAMSRPAEQRTLPPPADVEPDWQKVAAVAAARGNEILE